MPPSQDRKVQLNFSICADFPDESSTLRKKKGKSVISESSPDSQAVGSSILISSDGSSDHSKVVSLDIDFNDVNTRRRLRAWLTQLEKDE